MKRIVSLQIAYVVAGLALNIVSCVRASQGLQTLSPVDPVTGMILMGVFAGVVAIWLAGFRRVAALLFVPLVYMISTAALNHLRNRLGGEWETLYASDLSWTLVFVTNTLGTLIFATSIVIAFLPKGRSPSAEST